MYSNKIYWIGRITVFCALLILVVASGCISTGDGKEENRKQNRSAQTLSKTTIPIEGMSCMSCVATVKKALSSIEGVKEVSVNPQEKNTIVKFDESLTSAEQLKAAINEAGYKAGNAQTMEK